MSTDGSPRKPAGSPSGGQFDAKHGSAPSSALTRGVVDGWDEYGPTLACEQCGAALVDIDMAEDDDGHQYSVGRCPNDCDDNPHGLHDAESDPYGHNDDFNATLDPA